MDIRRIIYEEYNKILKEIKFQPQNTSTRVPVSRAAKNLVKYLGLEKKYPSQLYTLDELKKMDLSDKLINLDWGGGKFDETSLFLSSYGIINLIVDPYARGEGYTSEVVNILNEKKNGKADFVTLSNVLNVLPDNEEMNIIKNWILRDLGKAHYDEFVDSLKYFKSRSEALKDAYDYLKPGGVMVLTVYEKTRCNTNLEDKYKFLLKSKGKWQECKKLEKYIPLIEKTLPGVSIEKYKRGFILKK